MTSATDWVLPATNTQKANGLNRDHGSSNRPDFKVEQPDSLQTFLRQNSIEKKPQVIRPKYHKQGSSTSSKQQDTPKYTGPSQPIPTLPGYSTRIAQHSGLPLPGTKELARQNSYDLARSDATGPMRASSLYPKNNSPKKPSEDQFRNILRNSSNSHQIDKRNADELVKSSTMKTAKQTVSEIPSPTSQKTTRRNLKPVNFFDSNRLMDPTSYHNSELELTLTEYAKFNSGLKKQPNTKAQKLEPIQVKNPVILDDEFEAILDDSLKFDDRDRDRNRQASRLFERPKPISSDIQQRRLQPAEITTKAERERRRAQAKSARRHYEEDDEIVPTRMDVSHSLAPIKPSQAAAGWSSPNKPARMTGTYTRGLLTGENGSKPPSELSFQGFLGTTASGNPQQQQTQQSQPKQQHLQTADSRIQTGREVSQPTPVAKVQVPSKILVSTQTETAPAEVSRVGMASQTDETYHQIRDTGKGMKERYQQRLRLKQLEEEELRKKNMPPLIPIVIIPEIWEKFVFSKSEYNTIKVKTLLDLEVLEVRGIYDRVRPAPSYIGIMRDMFDEESVAELFPETVPHPSDIIVKFQIEPHFAYRTICSFHHTFPPKKVNFGVQAGRLLPNPNLDIQHTNIVARSNLSALLPKNQASSAVILKPVQLPPPVTPYIVRIAPDEHLEDDGVCFFDEEDSEMEFNEEDKILLEDLEIAAFIPYLDFPNDHPLKWKPQPIESRSIRTGSPKPRRISVFIDEVKPLKFSLIDKFVHKERFTSDLGEYSVSRPILRESVEKNQTKNSQNIPGEREFNPYKLKSFGNRSEFVSHGQLEFQNNQWDKKGTKDFQIEDSRGIQTEELHSWTEPDSQIANVSATAVLGNTYRKIPSYKGSHQSYWFEVVDQGELYESKSQSQDDNLRQTLEISYRLAIAPGFALQHLEYAIFIKTTSQRPVRTGPLTLQDFVPSPAAQLATEKDTLRQASVRVSRDSAVRPTLNATDTLWKCRITSPEPLPVVTKTAPSPLDLQVPGMDSIQKMLPIGVAPDSKRLSFKGSPRNSSAHEDRNPVSARVVHLADIRPADRNTRLSPKQMASRSVGLSEARPPAQPLVRWTPDWVSNLRKSPEPVGREQIQLSSDAYMKNKANFSRRVVYPTRPS